MTENGRTLRTIPISGGVPDTPTHNGTMVVMHKIADIRMNSETVGLVDWNLPYAQWIQRSAV